MHKVATIILASCILLLTSCAGFRGTFRIRDFKKDIHWNTKFRFLVDTDGDGIMDNIDMNPQAGPKENLTDEQKIMKLVIEDHLKEHNSNRMTIVTVATSDDKMEFSGYDGIVICLTREEANNYKSIFGWGNVNSPAIMYTIIEEIQKSSAMVRFGWASGPLGGAGYVIKCEKDKNGEWKIVSKRMEVIF